MHIIYIISYDETLATETYPILMCASKSNLDLFVSALLSKNEQIISNNPFYQFFSLIVLDIFNIKAKDSKGVLNSFEVGYSDTFPLFVDSRLPIIDCNFLPLIIVFWGCFFFKPSSTISRLKVRLFSLIKYVIITSCQ